MTTYEEKLALLTLREEAIRTKERELEDEHRIIREELAQLETERLATSPVLTKREIVSIRKAMTVVGKAVTSSDVVFGHIHLVDEEPEETAGGYMGDHTNKYSIRMLCKFVEDHAVGLEYTVVIKTQNPHIQAIVRNMLGKGAMEEGDMPTNYWNADWDYYTTFSITNTISDEEYNEAR